MNKVIIEGYLSFKPCSKVSKDGRPYVFFILAVPGKKLYVDGDAIVPVLPSTYLPVVFFAKYSEKFAQDRTKGDLLLVEGHLATISLKERRISIVAERVNVKQSMIERQTINNQKRRFIANENDKEELKIIKQIEFEQAELDKEMEVEDICKYL